MGTSTSQIGVEVIGIESQSAICQVQRLLQSAQVACLPRRQGEHFGDVRVPDLNLFQFRSRFDRAIRVEKRANPSDA